MNLFSGWFLSPNFEVEIQSIDEFHRGLEEKPGGISVLLVSESYLNKNITQFQFCTSFMGALKPKNLYPLNDTGKSFFFIVPKDEPKKLSFDQPGKAHIASHIGALISLSLFKLGNKFETDSNFFVTFSEDIKSALEGEQHEFIIGVLQKSISNKVSKLTVKNTKQKQFLIILEESFFHKETLLRAKALSDAMCYTRTFINMPPNILNPDSYEKYLRSLVNHECDKGIQPNHIQIEVMDYDKLLKEGCGLICAVGQGSQIKPRIIKLTYSTNKNLKKIPHVSLVGKGITFDTGGYDIKPSSGMRIMKKDMGGSAAALGIFFACARLELPLRLTCWLPLAENMISGNAMRPGDVYKARNGLQIEIDNTDAEGRLVLADAISLACEEVPDWLIDLATLTGAARVSLGTQIDSLYGNDKVTSQLLYHSGIESGDWVWNLPLPVDYESYFDSCISDFANSGSSGFAGSITASLFLQKFVSISHWNHIDTYMWCDKPTGLWAEGGGATGKCVRLVTRAIESFIST
jgi:leucyl aminopeptidase